jgi:hypothetical protein
MILTKLFKKIFLLVGYELRRVNVRKNKILHRSRWEYQKGLILPQISARDIILDIGSGHNPIPIANILADYFPNSTFHRGGKLIEDRPLIVCSVNKIPLLSKSIEFVVCSHVLEHVESPVLACEELSRIAKAGYIETPAYGKDLLIGTGNMHKWQIVEFEGTMYFFEYSERQKLAHTTSPVMNLLCQKDFHPMQDFFWERQDVFNAMHLWKENPKIVEYQRTERPATILDSWEPILESELGDEPVLLTDQEINLLNSCLSTPDGLEPMKFVDGSFVNKAGNIRYPVRGKKIYFEMSKQE